MNKILAIGEAIRVAYLRGTKDPEKENMTETLHEMRDFLIQELDIDVEKEMATK